MTGPLAGLLSRYRCMPPHTTSHKMTWKYIWRVFMVGISNSVVYVSFTILDSIWLISIVAPALYCKGKHHAVTI